MFQNVGLDGLGANVARGGHFCDAKFFAADFFAEPQKPQKKSLEVCGFAAQIFLR